MDHISLALFLPTLVGKKVYHIFDVVSHKGWKDASDAPQRGTGYVVLVFHNVARPVKFVTNWQTEVLRNVGFSLERRAFFANPSSADLENFPGTEHDSLQLPFWVALGSFMQRANNATLWVFGGSNLNSTAMAAQPWLKCRQKCAFFVEKGEHITRDLEKISMQMTRAIAGGTVANETGKVTIPKTVQETANLFPAVSEIRKNVHLLELFQGYVASLQWANLEGICEVVNNKIQDLNEKAKVGLTAGNIKELIREVKLERQKEREKKVPGAEHGDARKAYLVKMSEFGAYNKSKELRMEVASMDSFDAKITAITPRKTPGRTGGKRKREADEKNNNGGEVAEEDALDTRSSKKRKTEGSSKPNNNNATTPTRKEAVNAHAKKQKKATKAKEKPVEEDEEMAEAEADFAMDDIEDPESQPKPPAKNILDEDDIEDPSPPKPTKPKKQALTKSGEIPGDEIVNTPSQKQKADQRDSASDFQTPPKPKANRTSESSEDSSDDEQEEKSQEDKHQSEEEEEEEEQAEEESEDDDDDNNFD